MNTDQILNILNDAGFYDVAYDGVDIIMEDPSCILRSFETFIEYAWVFISALTVVLIFGWVISVIRGGTKLATLGINLRNLVLIFGGLSAVWPIINVIFDGDVMARGCKTVGVNMENIQKILDSQNAKFASSLPTDIPAFNSGALLAPQPTEQWPSATISATVTNDGVIYTLVDGSRIRRTRGSPAWRNNNPGNITCGAGLLFGAVACNGRFLVYPDEDTGMRAIVTQLKRGSYQTLTLGGAINRWAPPFENDTAAYQRTIERETGMSLGTPMSQLNDEQLGRVAHTIRRVEGWNIGTEVSLQ